jgi:hypothetical protein
MAWHSVHTHFFVCIHVVLACKIVQAIRLVKLEREWLLALSIREKDSC